jgi:hypothetical protein
VLSLVLPLSGDADWAHWVAQRRLFLRRLLGYIVGREQVQGKHAVLLTKGLSDVLLEEGHESRGFMGSMSVMWQRQVRSFVPPCHLGLATSVDGFDAIELR